MEDRTLRKKTKPCMATSAYNLSFELLTQPNLGHAPFLPAQILRFFPIKLGLMFSQKKCGIIANIISSYLPLSILKIKCQFFLPCQIHSGRKGRKAAILD